MEGSPSQGLERNEIIAGNNKELEASIPPRRVRRKTKPNPTAKSQSKSNRRIANKEHERYKSAVRFFNKFKPKYHYQIRKKTPDNTQIALAPSIATKLAQARTKSWKGHVITSSSYPELVAQVKHRWEDIDVGLSQGFVQKNIAYETARFSLEDERLPATSSIDDPFQSYKYIVPLI